MADVDVSVTYRFKKQKPVEEPHEVTAMIVVDKDAGEDVITAAPISLTPGYWKVIWKLVGGTGVPNPKFAFKNGIDLKAIPINVEVEASGFVDETTWEALLRHQVTHSNRIDYDINGSNNGHTFSRKDFFKDPSIAVVNEPPPGDPPV